MRKFLALLCLIFTSTFIFAQEYKIDNVIYELNPSSWEFLGTTKQYALEQAVSIDYNKVFKTREEFDKYVKDLETRIHNTRAFQTIEIKVQEGKPASKESPVPVTLTIITTDSIHLLGVPYPKYNSNDGFIFKLKIKDTNFLGSLNTMSSDINFHIDTSEPETKYIVGLTFSFDYPFKAGIFDAVFINDHSLNYTFGETMPEWNAKTGLKFTLPKGRYSLAFEVYQSLINNLDYKVYDDNFYFNNSITFSLPVNIVSFENYGTLTYSPSVNFNINYDIDGINQINSDLLGPSVSFSHSLSLGRVNWKNNMRNGLSASLSNAFSYNFYKKRLIPTISAELKYYKSTQFTDSIDYLNRIGLCADLYTNFTLTGVENNPYIGSDGSAFGDRLRGIRDTQYYSNGWEALTSPGIITLNLDFPFHLFSTNFTGRIMSYFNFDCQISPFIDIGLSYNKITQRWFNPKDGFYGAGMEVLVYPVKWSSFTVRGSIGFDIGRKLFGNLIDTSWRENASSYELYIGIGLHY